MIVVLRPVLPPPSQPLSSTAMFRDAVLLGEVVGGREPVPAGPDDDHVIGRLGLGRAPLLGPVPVAGQGIAGEGQKGESLHQRVGFRARCE